MKNISRKLTSTDLPRGDHAEETKGDDQDQGSKPQQGGPRPLVQGLWEELKLQVWSKHVHTVRLECSLHIQLL